MTHIGSTSSAVVAMIDARPLGPHPFHVGVLGLGYYYSDHQIACSRAELTTRLAALDTAIPQLRAKVPDDREFWKALSEKMDFVAECDGSSDIEWGQYCHRRHAAQTRRGHASRRTAGRRLTRSVADWLNLIGTLVPGQPTALVTGY